MRNNTRYVCFATLIVVGLAAAVVRARSQSSQAVAQCIADAQALGLAVMEYTQDYDEQLPLFKQSAAFPRALAPYLRAPFPVCPVTRAPYQFNVTLSGKPLATFTDPDNVRLLADARPHPDGKSTVVYLDDYTTYGGVDVVAPNAQCIDNIRAELLATDMYSQDYDGTLPLYSTPSEYQEQLYPYIRNIHEQACPITHTLYLPNNVLSAKPLADFRDFAIVPVVRDQYAHPNGLFTIGYLDGHVVQK